VDAAELRASARRAFDGTLGRRAGPDADRWADRLADALLEVLGTGPASRRWRSLLAARNRWEERWRAFRPPGEPEALVRVGRIFEAGDLVRADRLARLWASRLPDDPRWLDILGAVTLAEDRREEGRAFLREAIRLDPHLLMSRIRLANDLIATGGMPEAEALLERGLRLAGLRLWAPSALFQLAWIRVRRGETASARAVLERTVRLLDRMPATPENRSLRPRVRSLLDSMRR
jgi:tetratricopeptide (TPR) repeat protein